MLGRILTDQGGIRRQIRAKGASGRQPRACAALTLVLLCMPTARAGEASAAAVRAVQGELSALIAGVRGQTRVALVVENLADGSRWFENEPRTLLKPASVLKVFTTAAALERFGPNFAFETRVYQQGDELWVIGSGDPGLGDERLAERHNADRNAPFNEWAARLQARGVQSLRNIALDDTIFDREWRHPDWPADQADTWYQAPIGGLNLNDNCLDARAEVVDRIVRLVLQPPLPEGFVKNELKPGKSTRANLSRRADSDVFNFIGAVNRTAEFSPAAVRVPTIFFGHALKEALEQRGGELHGQVVRRAIAEDTLRGAAPLAVHRTSLPDVVWRSNTFSQNMFAECLLKSLEAYEPDGRRSGRPGSWEGGNQVLRQTLTRMGVDVTDAVFRDGSGLSHENRVSAEQIVRLMSVMRRHRCATVFLDSLAVAGDDGSMRKRFAEAGLAGRIRGKTGTIAGVSTLTGYVTRADGTELVFALLINGPDSGALPVRVCRALVGPGGAATREP